MPSSPEVKLDHFEIRTIILRTDQSSGSVENDQEKDRTLFSIANKSSFDTLGRGVPTRSGRFKSPGEKAHDASDNLNSLPKHSTPCPSCLFQNIAQLHRNLGSMYRRFVTASTHPAAFKIPQSRLQLGLIVSLHWHCLQVLDEYLPARYVVVVH